MKLKRKVLAYITKGEKSNREILVFEQMDNPDAGLQVPAGIIEDNEFLVDALYREIEEITGIPRKDLELQSRLNFSKYVDKNRDVIYERNIFHLAFTGKAQEKWVHRVEKDDSITLCHRWTPVKNLPKLAANQDQDIKELTY